MDLQKLKRLMYEHGITQKQLALYLHVSEPTIITRMAGKQEFKVSELKRLCYLFKVDANYFF